MAKRSRKNSWLVGISTDTIRYNDNTPATENERGTNPNRYWLPGVFVENEIDLSTQHKLLLGMRLDHHPEHAFISSPRARYKINFDAQTLFRVNFGTGFRVVNIFTEDHAALTGARDLVIEEQLAPEQSYNFTVNFYKKIYTSSGWIWTGNCGMAHLL